MTVSWWLRGGYVAVMWRLRGGYVAATWWLLAEQRGGWRAARAVPAAGRRRYTSLHAVTGVTRLLQVVVVPTVTRLRLPQLRLLAPQLALRCRETLLQVRPIRDRRL